MTQSEPMIVVASGIPVHCAHDKIVSTVSLIPNPRNPNKHSDRQVGMLAKIIKANGWRNPICVSKRSGFVVKGHARLLAAKRLGLEYVPVDNQNYENEAVEWEDMVADNRIAELAELDKEQLRKIMDELPDVDVELLGFSSEDFEKFFHTADSKEGSTEELMQITSEQPGVASLKEDAYFPSDEPFGIPLLRADRLTTIPEPLEVWIGEKESEPCDNYLYVLGGSSIRGLDLSRALLAFYTEDVKFEQFWTAPSEFTGKLLNRKIKIAVTPNYSLWMWMPEAVRIWNTYRSRWCGRYMQEAGIYVIPDVNFADAKSFEYAFAGIPKNPPAISIQLQTATRNQDDRYRCKQGIEEAIRRIQPVSVLFYVGDNGEELVKSCDLQGVHPVIVSNWISKRRQYIERILPKQKQPRAKKLLHTETASHTGEQIK